MKSTTPSHVRFVHYSLKKSHLITLMLPRYERLRVCSSTEYMLRLTCNVSRRYMKEQAIVEVEAHVLAKRRASLKERRRLEKEWKLVTATATGTAAMEQGNAAAKKVHHKAAKKFDSATAKPRAAFDITATNASDTALNEASREKSAQTAGQEAVAAAGAPPVFAGKSAPAMQRWQVKKAEKARKQAAVDAALAKLGVDDDLLAFVNPGVVMRGAAEEMEEEEGHTRVGIALLGKQAEEMERASVHRRKKGGKRTGASGGGSTGIKAVSAIAEGRKGGGKHRKGKGGVPSGVNASSTAVLIQDGAQGHGLATLYVVCVSLSLLLFGLLFRICRNVIIP